MKRKPTAFVTEARLKKHTRNLLKTIGEFAAKSVRNPLLKRIEELEARPVVKHCGIWAEGKQYRPANLVTHNGGLWLAQKATKQRPGQSNAWQLVVKSGAAA